MELADQLQDELDSYKRHTLKLVQRNNALKNQLKIANEMKEECRRKNVMLETEIKNIRNLVEQILSKEFEDLEIESDTH